MHHFVYKSYDSLQYVTVNNHCSFSSKKVISQKNFTVFSLPAFSAYWDENASSMQLSRHDQAGIFLLVWIIMGLQFFLTMIMHVVSIISILNAYLMNYNIDSFLLCFLLLGWGEGERKGTKKTRKLEQLVNLSTYLVKDKFRYFLFKV